MNTLHIYCSFCDRRKRPLYCLPLLHICGDCRAELDLFPPKHLTLIHHSELVQYFVYHGQYVFCHPERLVTIPL